MKILDIVTEKKIIGAPDIIIEILSPSTSYNDKIRKKGIYERFGVKEYWIVDPVHLYIDQFILSEAYMEIKIPSTHHYFPA